MGISVADISSVIWLGSYCVELVPAQLAGQFIALRMVALVEFVLIFVLGSSYCLFTRSALSRFLSACANRASAGISAFADFVSQRQSWGDGLDGQSQPSLPSVESCASLPHGWGGSVVCRFVVVGPQSPGFVGGVALVESRTPSPPFSDLKFFSARALSLIHI